MCAVVAFLVLQRKALLALETKGEGGRIGGCSLTDERLQSKLCGLGMTGWIPSELWEQSMS